MKDNNLEPVETIEKIEVEFEGNFLTVKYIEFEGVIERLSGPLVNKCLINGKPYWCNSGRRFTKDSFDAAVKNISSRPAR